MNFEALEPINIIQKGGKTMIAVGIDISKSKSTVAILNSDGSVLVKPYTMAHTQSDMCALADYLRTFDEPLTILMEYTGHYHYPVLKKLQQEGFPVCVINPYQMKKYDCCWNRCFKIQKHRRHLKLRWFCTCQTIYYGTYAIRYVRFGRLFAYL